MSRSSANPTSHHEFRPRTRDAFTLVEMLVVVGILAIVTGTVIVAFERADGTAGDELTRQRMAAVREAILQFRADMSYYPGTGPLAPTNLKLDRPEAKYVDGENPSVELPALTVRQAWASHAMNLWQLMEQPVDATNPERWAWDIDAKRGWNGPYLNRGFRFLLDGAGTATKYDSGNRLNRLYAVADAFQRERSGAYLRWFTEGQSPETTSPPAKSYIDKHGQPLIFIPETDAVSNTTTYFLVSMGPNGEADNDDDNDDDLRLEVGRE